MGRSPKAPKEERVDPALLKEIARKKSMIITQDEQKQSSQFGTGATNVAGKDTSQELQNTDISKLAGSKKQAKIDQLNAELSGTPERVRVENDGDSGGFRTEKNSRYGALKDEIEAAGKDYNDADREEIRRATEGNKINDLIRNNRKRRGTQKVG